MGDILFNLVGNILFKGIFGGIGNGLAYPFVAHEHSFIVKNTGPNEIAVRVFKVQTSKVRCGNDPLCVKGIVPESDDKTTANKYEAMKAPIVIPSGTEKKITYSTRSSVNPKVGYRLFWLPKSDDLHLYDLFVYNGTFPYYDPKDLATINKRCLPLPADKKTIVINGDSGRVVGGGSYKSKSMRFRVRVPKDSVGKKWVQILQKKRGGGGRAVAAEALTRPIAISPGKSHLFQIRPSLHSDLFLSWSCLVPTPKFL